MDIEKKEEYSSFGGNSATSDRNKSSMQILSELFSTFDAEPPVIVKKEKKDRSSDGKKRNKKKKKHKEKKHKKKGKKKKKSSNSTSCSDSDEFDLAKLLIKKEKDKTEEKIKIEGTSLSLDIKVEINKEEQKVKSENDKSSKSHYGESTQKIHIKDINISSIQRDSKPEEGEITDSEVDTKKKHKDRDKHYKRKSSRERSRSREKRQKIDDRRNQLSESENCDKYKHKSHRHDNQDDFYKGTYKSEKRYEEQSKSRDYYYSDRNRDEHRTRRKDRDSPSFRSDSYRSRSDERRSRSTRDYYRKLQENDRSIDRKRERDKTETERIDKKKLLEIARRNAVQMMKSGNLPGALTLGSKAQEKMIAAIRMGGKTVEELTEFCKSLSKKEELGELSSLSEREDSDADEPFHHPFKLKDRPTTITMNIKNAVPLPTKTTQERTTELRMQFPVSSGQQHRVNEEWIPVPSISNKSTNVKSKSIESPAPVPLAIEAAPPVPIIPLQTQSPDSLIATPLTAPPGPQFFPLVPATPESSGVDIGSVVSQRLTAMRKLQENPHDVQALTEMYKSNKEMDHWAKSKQQFGQFTGSTGAQVLSQAELSSGYQAWAKKDQLQTAAPVSGGMGMHLLQKMGWRPGEGLGKEKTGTLEPLLLEVKLDKKGLVANEEQSKNKKKAKNTQITKSLLGKHPVSLLGEFASKKKLGAPEYILDFECGPDHKKNFLFKVILNGVEYKPNVASANKKEAKANAASVALKQIGLIA
ncbi:hypothetical protein ABEB36_005274 [Hypothenemus hampei]|uniref:Protein SON n=1 Tax=Hypothenemus hampei TaxID=57062 RepID=A0ABD1EXM1_HYPHA